MIDKMTKYSFILLDGEQEKFLESLQELGVVDITRSAKPVDDKSAAMLSRIETLGSTISSLEGLEPGEATGPCEDPVAEFESISSSLEKCRAALASARSRAELYKPWGEFSPEAIARLEENGLKLRFYCVQSKKFDAGWASEYALTEIFRDAKNVWFVTVSDDPSYDFPVDEIPAPETTAVEMEEEVKRLEAEEISLQKRLCGLTGFLPQLQAELRKNTSDLDLYLANAASESAVDNYVCLFEGFAPVADEEKLTAEFDKLDAYWTKSAAAVQDNPPIKLKNNKFVKMFEVLTDMYGRPMYDGFDPTVFISIFFLLFFAFCMGDLGYGIILIALGFAMKKIKGFDDMAPLVVTLGIGTAVIGLLFHNFFSIDLLTVSWVPDWLKKIMLPSKIAGYDGTMVLALIIGVVHLCLAMIVKTYVATRNNGFLNSLGTWGWTLLIVGGVAVAAFALLGVMSSAVTKWVIIILGILSALGIFVFNDIHRNPLLNIGSGLWDTYNTATGLLGDVLSYLRLYALGLAGSMLGLAFNTMGNMFISDGGGVIAWIAFILIVVIGHTLNLAMCALGAFVHPLRLNFLEFFKNSGYEGNGRVYSPLSKTNNNQ